MLAVYEKMIQDCGYSGGQPYWDWTLDGGSLDKFKSSPIFDTVAGFGGNGAYLPGNFSNPQPGLFVGAPWDIPDRTGGGCIPDGPFKDWMVKLGPGTNIQPNSHCVRRDFAPISFTNMTSPESVADGLSKPDYGFFSSTTEFSVHAGGHLGVGGLYGVMADQWSSRRSIPSCCSSF
jgi:tyrosinase